VAHAYNPCYFIGRDQEDRGLKPACKLFERPYLGKKKKPSQKRADGVAQGEGPEFKPQYCKKEKRKKKKKGLFPPSVVASTL
jgi:hypothetical protein